MSMPDRIEPMVATTTTTVPRPDDAWAFELKWDGIRAIAHVNEGSARFTSRTLRDITGVYPELGPISESVTADAAVLDGEIIAFDSAGHPSFERLQRRMNVSAPHEVAAALREVPVAYVVFDLLARDGRSLLREPYIQRREALTQVLANGRRWQVPAPQIGGGAELLAVTGDLGLEGIVAKRLTSTYQPGRRSRDWMKIKNVHHQEAVIGGWIAGEGRLRDTVGALVLGVYDGDALQFIGKVGTGFDDSMRDHLRTMLRPLGASHSPFTGRQPQSSTIFVDPQLVCEVSFAHWTDGATLRHPVFRGLRHDKDPFDVVRTGPPGRP